VRQCATVCDGSVRQSSIVWGSASGSVWQCERQCAAVWSERQCMSVRAAACAAVYVCAAVTQCAVVRQCKRQCVAVRAQQCSRVQQCAGLCAAVWHSVSVRVAV
jgi:hypothetical protein